MRALLACFVLLTSQAFGPTMAASINEEIKSAVLMSVAAGNPSCGAKLTDVGKASIRHYFEKYPGEFKKAFHGLSVYASKAMQQAVIPETDDNFKRFVCRLAKKQFRNLHWAEMITWSK